ncbi:MULTISPECIES: hypothetical protein [Aquimarina]|uniref:hypothetical protein n=1 Tax=Aquimarina TaxID=290174 RepID=UPI001358AC63|nr:MULTISPECIES: hypothetical protein [Aquimarina]
MKKKKFSGLNLDKQTISKFQSLAIKGGTQGTLFCPTITPPYSGGTCGVSECDCE